MDRRILIGIGVGIILALGMLVFGGITGNVVGGQGFITGAVVAPMKVENEAFKISDFGNGENSREDVEKLNGGDLNG